MAPADQFDPRHYVVVREELPPLVFQAGEGAVAR